MNDREMLEFAAKAYGLDDAQYAYDELMATRYGFSEAIWSAKLYDETDIGYWNPRANDGDAFRLETSLNISVINCGNAVRCNDQEGNSSVEMLANHGGCRLAARRYASTKLAAEIGKAMP